MSVQEDYPFFCDGRTSDGILLVVDILDLDVLAMHLKVLTPYQKSFFIVCSMQMGWERHQNLMWRCFNAIDAVILQ